MNSALNWMLLQPADDAHGSALAFAAWPCDWDVDFKLWAPRNTLVEAKLSGGKIQKFVVTPLERSALIRIVNCR